MGHMKPDVQQFEAYHVETECGTEVVPRALCGKIDLDAEPTEEAWEGLSMYLEGSRIEGVEHHEGWYARLSAPGYLDCTSWDGPHATRDAALASLLAHFECDEEGDDLSEGPCSDRPPA
jgi:hypothetical protein